MDSIYLSIVVSIVKKPNYVMCCRRLGFGSGPKSYFHRLVTKEVLLRAWLEGPPGEWSGETCSKAQGCRLERRLMWLVDRVRGHSVSTGYVVWVTSRAEVHALVYSLEGALRPLCVEQDRGQKSWKTSAVLLSRGEAADCLVG